MRFLQAIFSRRTLAIAAVLLIASGCTVHPAGETAERNAAMREGAPFAKSVPDRQLPPLSAKSSADELVRYALLASPELEQHYWEWRSAIEQIPQDGTQATNLVLSAGVPITHGSSAFNRTTVTVANDPMADIVWPSKLSAAAERALQNAKAAGYRFQQAKYDLRQKVLNAYYDYSQAAELLRLDRTELQILNTAVSVTQAGVSSGRSTQSDVLKAQTQIDLLQNQLTDEQGQLPAVVAALNGAMGRTPTAVLDPDITLPELKPLPENQSQLLRRLADRNPELSALNAEELGRARSIELAELQRVPDFSISAGTTINGTAQSLLGSVTVPFLRHEAINAAIAQTQANLNAQTAMERSARNDLASRVVADVASLDGSDKQLQLFGAVILPRVRQASDIMRSSYESRHATITDLFESQRSVIAVERLIAQLKTSRLKHAVDLESIAAVPIDATNK